jgi:hypothetical protein
VVVGEGNAAGHDEIRRRLKEHYQSPVDPSFVVDTVAILNDTRTKLGDV